MRRMLAILALAAGVTAAGSQPAMAQTECDGTSGSATINGVPWTTQCVIAATSAACVDSLGQKYECFQILGVDSLSTYAAVGILLTQEPMQGQTYALGGASGHAAIVLGDTGIWGTGSPPYTGSVEVTVYDPVQATIRCTFSFTAQSLLFGPDLVVTNGSFEARLVGTEPKTWSDVKTLYRASGPE